VFFAIVFILVTLLLGYKFELGFLYFLLTYTVNYYNAMLGDGEISGAVANWVFNGIYLRKVAI